MTHFAVVVAADDALAALAPFEQYSGTYDPLRPYLVFDDKEDELQRAYQHKSTELIIMPDGSRKLPWDACFEVKDLFAPGPSHVVPEHLERRQIPFKELFQSVEQYAHEWCGYENRDTTTGRFGYWINPQGKWDWLTIGGGYSGRLKLKAYAADVDGKPYHGIASDKPGYADSCYYEDIDIEAMRQATETAAAKRYDELHSVIAGRKLQTFQEFLKEFKGSDEEARRAYWNDPVQTALRGIDVNPSEYEELRMDRDAYLKAARDTCVMGFVLLIDGVWYSREQFSQSGELLRVSSAEWHQQFMELFNTLPPDTIITIVDCHT